MGEAAGIAGDRMMATMACATRAVAPAQPCFIAADVGGTNARVSLVRTDANGELQVLSWQRYPCADYPSLTAILAEFVEGHPAREGIDCMVIASAGVVLDDEVINSNLPWRIKLAELRDSLHLRELHVEMDNAVAAAYGWSDLDLGHGFHETPQGVRFTISEAARREVLARLLQLNHERYEEEVRQGLHEKDKKKAKTEQPARQKPKKLAQPEGQMNLLAEPEAQDAAGAGEPVLSTPAAEIGSWDRCKCLACGKTVMGFSIAEHTQSEHQGKDPGYRKMG